MEKGGHCRQVMRRGARRGVDVAALLLLLLAERHLLQWNEDWNEIRVVFFLSLLYYCVA